MDYKKVFTIHKYLIRNEIPDDLMPIIFEYIGNLDESVEDLINHWCFHQLIMDEPLFSCRDGKIIYIGNTIFGFYCSVCQKIYKFQYHRQLREHLEGNVHRFNIKYEPYPKPLTSAEFNLHFKYKYHRLHRYNKHVRERILNSIKLKHIHFDKNINTKRQLIF